jgi:holin-like protein
MLKKALLFTFSFALLVLCLCSAKMITLLLQLPFPPPLLGMLILLFLLFFNFVKPSFAEYSIKPILSYMALFFIPVGAGIIQYLTLFSLHWPVLILCLVLIPCVGLMLVGVGANKGKLYD